MTNEDYPLTVEILKDRPCIAILKKGEICKARYDKDNDFHVLDEINGGHWCIMAEEAKVIKNG